MASIGSLFKSSTFYAIANLMQRGLAFLLIPMYTRYLSKAEFGAMDLLYQSIMILVIVASLGLPQGIVRGIYREDGKKEDLQALMGALVNFLLPLTIVITLVLYCFAPFWNKLLFKTQGQDVWIQLSALFFFSLILHQLPMQFLRATQQSAQYSTWSFFTFVLILGSNVYFIAYQKMGLIGVIWGNVFGYLSCAILDRKSTRLNSSH